MKNISVQIPDNKYPFFMELLKNFDFVKVKDEDIIIPEEHKQIVRERIKMSEKDPSRRLKWDDAKHKIKL
jgi:hypothetical protein